MTSREIFLSSVDQTGPSFSLKRTAVTLEAKKKRTEEDSVSCPMKYSTDVECGSDSLTGISYRDINQFTYVNLSYNKPSTQIARTQVCTNGLRETRDMPANVVARLRRCALPPSIRDLQEKGDKKSQLESIERYNLSKQ
jgi:hypothetical protein